MHGLKPKKYRSQLPRFEPMFLFLSSSAKSKADIRVHRAPISCVSGPAHKIVWIKFGSFPGAIGGIHFELQRPKYFVNVYIV